jgi:lysine-N-methylase
MAERPQLAALPADACFSCEGCGECCRGRFTILLSPEDLVRLRLQGWEEDGAVPFRHGALRGRHRLATRPDGSCVFLDDANRCRIHAKFGEAEKPLACRVYPYRLVRCGAEVRADLRFDCPAVAGNRGMPLSAQRDILDPLVAELYPEASDAVPAFSAHASLPWPRSRRVAGLFLRMLRNDALDVVQRLIGCVDAIAMLRELTLEVLTDQQLDTLLDAVYTRVSDEVGRRWLDRVSPTPAVRTAFRQHLCVYGREDHWGARTSMLQRFSLFWRMTRGQGMVPALRRDFPEVPFQALEEPMGVPPDSVVEPLLRFLRRRLDSLGFFGPAFYDYSFLDGLGALLLTVPMACWLARAYALGAGRPLATADDLARAIGLVDHSYGVSHLYTIRSERLRLHELTRRPHLRALIGWYGR